MMMSAGLGIGQPPYNPISGMGGPQWGMPMTSTPIGLPGPPHLPLGGPASLQSHTIRNNTVQDIPKPVEHFLIDVKQSPGIRMPPAVNHVEYEEIHPTYSPGAVSYPKFAFPKK
ncbi:MAG: hypothetical protein CMJ78_12330 [Planctomycetaceae bacterium]|nr:hypothetical protein [Planctomycetaceae bacterium]